MSAERHLTVANSSTSHGFTLIEILVAVAVAGVVIGAVMSVYHGIGVAARKSSNTHVVTMEATSALDRISRDATCTLAQTDRTSSPFVLDPGGALGEQWPTLLLKCVGDMTDSTVTQEWEAVSVRYYVASDGEGDPVSLHRELKVVDRASGRDQVTDDEIASDVLSLSIEASDGKVWYSQWPQEDGAPVPAGARIVISCRKALATIRLETMVPIPAGA